MHPLLFAIGPIKVYSFGVMLALGFVAGYFVVRSYLVRRGVDGDMAGSIFLWALIGGVAGGRIYYALEHWHDLLADPRSVLLSTGGLTFYGGLIGGALAVAWIIVRHRASFTICADATGPAITIGYILGRVSCQLSGDGDYGRASTVPWAMSYPHGTVPKCLCARKTLTPGARLTRRLTPHCTLCAPKPPMPPKCRPLLPR